MVLSESYLFVMMSLYGRFQECGSQCNALFFVIALLAFAWHIDAIAPQNTPRKLLAVVPGKAQAPTTAAAVPVESFALQHQPAKNVNGTSATQQVQFTVFHPANCSQATDAQQRWCQVSLPALEAYDHALSSAEHIACVRAVGSKKQSTVWQHTPTSPCSSIA